MQASGRNLRYFGNLTVGIYIRMSAYRNDSTRAVFYGTISDFQHTLEHSDGFFGNMDRTSLSQGEKRNGFMSFITMISIIGIALGVTALITVLSVMNGFQKEIRGQLLNVAPHAEIGYYDNGNGLGWQNLREIVKDKRSAGKRALHIRIKPYLPMRGSQRGSNPRYLTIRRKECCRLWKRYACG